MLLMRTQFRMPIVSVITKVGNTCRKDDKHNPAAPINIQELACVINTGLHILTGLILPSNEPT